MSLFADPFRQRRGPTPPIPVAQAPAPAPAPPATPEEKAAPAAPAAPARDAAAEETARARAVLEERIHFDFDRATLRPDAREILRRKADVLRANPEVALRIEGHADERGPEKYNLSLGLRRANAAKEQLVRLGIEPARLETTSAGESRPLATGHDESAWAQNRRVEFHILRGGERLRMPN